MNKPLNRYSSFLICVALALATLAVYWPVRNYDFVKYDDDAYVTDNYHVTSGLSIPNVRWAFTTPHVGNWLPLTWLSFMLDCQLFGANPGWMHLVNLLLHIANTLLLFAVLKKMTGSLWPSAFVAALFALHPLHVESIAWITERKDVLSTLFLLLTLAAYVSYVRGGGLFRYLLTILLFVFGLLAKPMLVTLPFLLLLLDYWPLERFAAPRAVKTAAIPDRRRVFYRIIIEKIPFLVLSAVSSVITFIVQKGSGAVMDVNTLSLQKGVANAFLSYAKYIGKMFWPQNLAIFYPLDIDGIPLWQIVLCVLLLLVISIFAVRFGRKHRYLPVGWFWFVGTLIPVIGLVQSGAQSLADRYTYISLTGLFIIIAFGADRLTAKWNYRKYSLSLLAAVVLGAASVCTSLQLKFWQNSITLFQRAVDVTSNNFIIYNNFANVLGKMGKLNQSLEYLNKALALRPNSAEIHNNLGNAFRELGKVDQAIEHYKEAVKYKPDLADAHFNLGVALSKKGDFEDAVAEYQKTLAIDPVNSDALSEFGFIYARQGKLDQAVDYYNRAIAIDPNNVIAHGRLGLALAEQGKFDDAIREFKIVLKARPDDVEMYCNLGILLDRQNKTDQAIEQYRRALQIKPNDSKARELLDAALVKNENKK
jgi:tetratricopeptide (TPR) repeat protein